MNNFASPETACPPAENTQSPGPPNESIWSWMPPPGYSPMFRRANVQKVHCSEDSVAPSPVALLDWLSVSM